MKTASILSRLAPPTLMLAAEIWLACTACVVISTPAAAQFWDYPFWGQRQAPQQRQYRPWGGWQQAPEQRQQQPVDASKAPPPRKPESAPTKTVVVMGDSMADWLGFGLEDAFAETPEIGVTRKYRTYSGLIRGESRKEVDWPQTAKEILAGEKPDFVVMMIGTSDRQSIRERPPRATPKQPPTQTKLEGGQPTQINPAGAPPDTPEGAAGAEQQKSSEPQKPAAAPEPPPGPMMTYEFRSEKWGEAYGRRIDEMIAVLKSKGVPVLWVGLPATRGTRSTADLAYLNELYRGHAEKAGIAYVDVWDGFVDENGNFAPRGPDFEGQIRLLRAGDGVHFTKAGARKLAHYVEREIRHLMLSRGAPMALPTPEEPQPDASRPGSPAVRPVAGPVVPLTTPASAPEGLLGAGAQRPAVADPNANRVLVKGEPLPALSGRADDFAWPRPDAALLPPEPSAPPASPPTAKPGTAGSPPGSKPAAPAPGKKHAPAAAAAGEDSRRPLSLTDDRRRRTSPDNGPRPPAVVPLAPTRGGW